jgi:IclR family acetate operon transcriptional repressor
VQSLSRGLHLLEHVVHSDHPVPLTEAAELIGVDKSSAHRLLATLIGHGYLLQDHRRHYIPGPAILEIAAKSGRRQQLHSLAGPCLAELARSTGETAHLAILSRNRALLTGSVTSTHTLAVTSRVGDTDPLHCSALGKALICDLPSERLLDLLGRPPFEQFTPHTHTFLPQVLTDCRIVHNQGVAMDDEEYREGVRCLAAPVRDFSGAVVAAVGISGPADRLCSDEIDRASLAVRHAARELSGQLGYSSSHP